MDQPLQQQHPIVGYRLLRRLLLRRAAKTVHRNARQPDRLLFERALPHLNARRQQSLTALLNPECDEGERLVGPEAAVPVLHRPLHVFSEVDAYNLLAFKPAPTVWKQARERFLEEVGGIF